MQIRGLTQRECAHAAGMQHPGLNRILNGLQSPSLATCERLASVVGLSVEQLFASASVFDDSMAVTA